MAIDFLICGLLFISFTINLLPLGAFWVTPGLRTTASRFVINLLIINLISCCILAPTLFLNGNLSATSMEIETNNNAFEFHQFSATTAMAKHRIKIMQEQQDNNLSRNSSKSSSENTFHCNNSTYCKHAKDEEEERSGEKIVITEVNEKYLNEVIASDRRIKLIDKTPMMRCWSIDLVAAWGALAVLLVVGDTWMAVRDPLRYHSRISGVKSWILIAMTWVFGILFGLMSALREINFQCSAVVERKFYSFPWQIELSSITTSTVFSMVFACIYFIVIILLPFGFVCGMYWRIVSEAKENGVRMRQNGSSPLLQSATNLNVHRNSLTGITAQSVGVGGLHMQIDRKRNRKDSVVKISETRNKLTTQSTLPPLSEPEENMPGEEESNTGTRPLSSSDAEYSMKQISPLTRQSSEELPECNRLNNFRQIKSSPNIQKYFQTRRSSLNGFETSFHNQRHTVLQALPGSTINTSPKALSYMSSIRRRLSNASSLFKQREESRAARISILVVIMFLVSYLPYGLLVLLQGPVIENFPYSTQLAVFMILLANLISPFIFAYRNKQVRHGVTRLFGLDARSKEHRLHRKGIFLRYGTKARISVKRSSSKVSAYSMSSCRYLSPILKHTNRSLKSKNEQSKLKRTNTFPSNNAQETSCSPKVATLRPAKSENIEVVDTTVNLQNDDCHDKFSIFKLFCKNAKTSNCPAQLPMEV